MYLMKYRIMVVYNDELVVHIFQIASYVLNTLESDFANWNSNWQAMSHFPLEKYIETIGWSPNLIKGNEHRTETMVTLFLSLGSASEGISALSWN